MLNPILNTSKTWEWIDTMLTGAICMVRLYNSAYDLNKRDLLVTKNLCLDSAITAFNCMELSPENKELAEQIETKRKQAYYYAMLSAAHPESCLSDFNAHRAFQHKCNVDILKARLKARINQEYGVKIL
jgi:hypothetical protein